MTDDHTEHPKKKKARRSGKPEGGPAQHSAPNVPEEADMPTHTTGTTLRIAREKMGLTLEDVSSSINVRVVQLHAIEDDRIDQLPGMTYAVGFVRSYAQFVKLDAKEIVDTFKREHEGEPAAKTALHFSDPISEDKLPGPVLIGAAVFGIVVLFVAWSLLSSDDDGVELADNIPPAPVVGTASGQPTLADAQPLTGYTTGMITPAETTAATTATTAGTAETSAVSATDIAAAQPSESTAETEMVVRPTRPTEERPAAAQQQVINVKRGKTRVMIEASQKSWVQISDNTGKVIYKKVMAQGEQFFVPDQPGMTLVTSNAGGLNIIVDGVQAQSLGRSGEILRGVALNPDELKKKRIRVRN
jgi:cytoskeleton protein RodZ